MSLRCAVRSNLCLQDARTFALGGLNLQIKDAKCTIADLTTSMEKELEEVALITNDNGFECFQYLDVYVSDCTKNIARRLIRKFKKNFKTIILHTLSINDDWISNLTSTFIPILFKTILPFSPNSLSLKFFLKPSA